MQGTQGTIGIGSTGSQGLQGDQGIQGLKGDKGDAGTSGVAQVLKPCSTKSAKITRLPDGTLLSVTPADGQTTLDWGVNGSNAPSYSIGITNTCAVYVDYTGKVCTVNPAKNLCASPL